MSTAQLIIDIDAWESAEYGAEGNSRYGQLRSKSSYQGDWDDAGISGDIDAEHDDIWVDECVCPDGQKGYTIVIDRTFEGTPQQKRIFTGASMENYRDTGGEFVDKPTLPS